MTGALGNAVRLVRASATEAGLLHVGFGAFFVYFSIIIMEWDVDAGTLPFLPLAYTVALWLRRAVSLWRKRAAGSTQARAADAVILLAVAATIVVHALGASGWEDEAPLASILVAGAFWLYHAVTLLWPDRRLLLSRLLSIEFVGEIILLIGVAAFFVYMSADSVEWGLGAQILPWIACGSGMFFLWLRIVAIFRSGLAETGLIMDTGFLETDDSPAVVAGRWLLLVLTTAALLVGVWTLGFHVGIPLYTILYLVVLGKVPWRWAVPPAVFFLAVVMLIYGQLLLSEWNTPHWVEWFALEDWWEGLFDPDNEPALAVAGVQFPLQLFINIAVGAVIMSVIAFATETVARRFRRS